MNDTYEVLQAVCMCLVEGPAEDRRVLNSIAGVDRSLRRLVRDVVRCLRFVEDPAVAARRRWWTDPAILCAKSVVGFPTVRRLDLQGSQYAMDSRLADVLRSLPLLEDFRIDKCVRIDADGAAAVFRGLPNLRALKLAVPLEKCDVPLDAFDRFPRLRSLELQGLVMVPEQFDSLLRLTGLVHLSLSTPMTDATVLARFVGQLTRLQNLQSLSGIWCANYQHRVSITELAEAIGSLESLGQLRKLAIFYIYPEAFTQIGRLTQLRILDMHTVDLDDAPEFLAETLLPALGRLTLLTNLYLMFQHIEPAGATALAKALRGLAHLELAHCHLNARAVAVAAPSSYAGLAAIATLRNSLKHRWRIGVVYATEDVLGEATLSVPQRRVVLAFDPSKEDWVLLEPIYGPNSLKKIKLVEEL